jgi:hypothetical protein
MAYVVDGKQHCESTGTTNKRLGEKILNLRIAEIIEGKYRLPKSLCPAFEDSGRTKSDAHVEALFDGNAGVDKHDGAKILALCFRKSQQS